MITKKHTKHSTLASINPIKAQFRCRTFHEPNLIQIKASPNHENPAF